VRRDGPEHWVPTFVGMTAGGWAGHSGSLAQT
jgi:hypothetical protein